MDVAEDDGAALDLDIAVGNNVTFDNGALGDGDGALGIDVFTNVGVTEVVDTVFGIRGAAVAVNRYVAMRKDATCSNRPCVKSNVALGVNVPSGVIIAKRFG